jgi:hypothetical protein
LAVIGLITYLWTITNALFVAFYKHYVLVCICNAVDNILMSRGLLTMSVGPKYPRNSCITGHETIWRPYVLYYAVTQLFCHGKIYFNMSVAPVTMMTILRTEQLWNLGSIPSKFTSERTALGHTSL